ncbi:MAG: hypothetical protein ACFFEF_01295 [Candidatus Thorarchaeota archaeon]
MSLISKIGYSSGSLTAALPQYAIRTFLFFYYAVVLHMNEFWRLSHAIHSIEIL